MVYTDLTLDMSQTITIESGESQSDAIDLVSNGLVGFITPAAIDATTVQLSIQASDAIDGTFNDVYVDGVKFALTFGVDEYNLISTEINEIFVGLRFIKITMETSLGVAVVQTADRIFTIIMRPI